MNCVIPSGAIRVFRDIVHCMASFGTEVILTCFPNQLTLSIGDNIEAYICQFQLDANFFQTYDVTLNTSFSENDMEEVSCRMNLESLEQIFQGIGTDEKLYDSLQIKLATPNPNASTLIEDVTILFELKFVNGLSKINRLTYFDGNRVPLVRCDHSKWKNHVSIPAKIILNWMKKFHTKGQDLLMIFQEDSLSLKTRDSSLSTAGPGNWKLNTEFSLGVDDFVTYKVEPNSSLSFSAKDIKTLSKFAQSIKSDVDFYFSEDGSPINFEVKFSSIVTGKLYIPALNTYIEEGDQTYQDPNIVFTSGGIDFDKSSITEISLQSHFNSTPSQAQRSVVAESNDINLHSQAFTEGSFRMQEFSTHSNNQSQVNISIQGSAVQSNQSNIQQKSNKRARDTPPDTKPQIHSHHTTDSSENTSQREARTNSQPLQKSDDPMTSGLSIGDGSDLSIQLPSSLPSFGNAIRNVISSTPTDSNANLNSVTPGQRQINIIQTSSDSQTLEAKNDDNNSNSNHNNININNFESNSNYNLVNEMGKVSISGEGDENEIDSEFGSDDEVPNTPPQKVFKLFDD